MKVLRLLLAVLAVVAVAGCAKKNKEITDSARREASLHVSEAQFAISVRDYARAEPLLAKAADLTPDVPGLWLELGKTRMRLNNRGGAKDAYKEALAGFEQAAQNRKNDPQWPLQQATVLVFLGRADEARALLSKLPAQFPDNRDVKFYVERKPVDAMLADPKVKELTL